jgi:hypothetical protein
MYFAVGGMREQHSFSTDNIVKQIMVTDKGAKRMKGFTFFPTILIGSDIQKMLVREKRDVVFFHNTQLLVNIEIYFLIGTIILLYDIGGETTIYR